ncbi:MAG: glycogen synthase [Clostridia bacterium]|nr:glycogen synthase [Clostridia bacterium]
MKRILFVASEAMPFITTGGMGEVVGALPKTLVAESDHDVRVILPYYRAVKEKFGDSLEFVGSTQIQLSWRKQYCGIFKAVSNGVIYYFVDNEYYFDRESVYGEFDDGERFAFFGKAVLEALPLIDFFPDILHAHDWQAALSVIYLRTHFGEDARYKTIKSIFTIHNIEYQGRYSMDMAGDLFGFEGWHTQIVEYDGGINLLKGAVECCDRLTTVSPTYANELHDDVVSRGLGPIIRRNAEKMCGILNGIDTDVYNPSTDPFLHKNFTLKTATVQRRKNKAEIQEFFGLPVRNDVVLIAMITRLVRHKGLDLVTDALHGLLESEKNVQMVVLGKGDYNYEHCLCNLSDAFPEQLRTYIGFDAGLAHRVYSGADLFLMPSESEPCGLAQMIAAHYGAVPIIRQVGGLRDSIKDCFEKDGIGFTFYEYNPQVMSDNIRRAIRLYFDQPDAFKKVRNLGMQTDFTWARSAHSYLELYNNL